MVSMEERPSDMLFQQHGSERRRILTLQFGPSWTEYFHVNGLKDPVTWPSRFLVFTPLNSFFWGYIKNALYAPPLHTTMAELAGRLRAAAASHTRQASNAPNELD